MTVKQYFELILKTPNLAVNYWHTTIFKPQNFVVAMQAILALVED